MIDNRWNLWNVWNHWNVPYTIEPFESISRGFYVSLSSAEAKALRSQTVISNKGRGGRRYLPFVFTEQGVAMLSSVLNSERAVEINIEIMRAFVRLREMISSNKDLARKLDALERKVESHDVHIRSLFEAIRQLDGAAGAQEAQDRLPSRRTRRALRQSITGVCIRVFEIAATWQFPSESVLELLNRRVEPPTSGTCGTIGTIGTAQSLSGV